MTALSFVWVHPYCQISGCDTSIYNCTNVWCEQVLKDVKFEVYDM